MSLLTECGGGATPERSGNRQSAQLSPLQEGRCGGGGRREDGYLRIGEGVNLINP